MKRNVPVDWYHAHQNVALILSNAIKSKDFTIGWNKLFFKKPSSKLVCTWEFVYNCTTGRRSLKCWFYFAFFFHVDSLHYFAKGFLHDLFMSKLQ